MHATIISCTEGFVKFFHKIFTQKIHSLSTVFRHISQQSQNPFFCHFSDRNTVFFIDL